MTGAHAFRRRRRCNSRTVRHAIRVGRETVSPGTSLAAGGRAGNVTWSDHHRKDKFIRTVFVFQSLDITDRNLDLLTGQNVGDGLGEDVWPLLIQQAGGLTAGFRGFIDGFGFFAPQNFAAHGAVADDHGHVIDRRILRQGKRIDRFNLFRERIFKLLRDDYARKKSANLRFYIRMFERTISLWLAVWIEHLKRASSGSAL